MGRSSASPLKAQSPHFAPRAKRMVFIFLEGGVSQVDSWDYKPLLQRDGGKPMPASIARPRYPFAPTGQLLASPFHFERRGDRGMWSSDLFPAQNALIDRFCFMHGLHHDNEDHNTAKTLLHTGAGRELRPTLGSWLAYGLGSENDNLPAFIEVFPENQRSRPTAFLPPVFQGAALGRPDARKPGRQWENLGTGPWPGQRRHVDLVQALNRARGPGDAALDTAVAQMELAFRMQTEAPELLTTRGESPATLSLYGIGTPDSDDFGRALLATRRFLERGVRFVLAHHATRKYGNLWDQHEHLERGHRGNARAVDQPIAGFIRDLDSRGLLDDTLVMIGSEFGRTPMFEIKDGGDGRLRNGRDHNPHGYTLWFAGGGMRAGVRHGVTDDYGYHAIDQRVHIHDLHATLLHCLGLDHTRLTYRHAGRDYRLTDVYGEVVTDVLT